MEKKGGCGEEGGMRKKKTQGRKKIPMELIEDGRKLHVCFSHRRKGLFKKASDLSVLCGAQVGLIVFSPGRRKHYTYCHGSLDAVLDSVFGPYDADAAEAARAAREIKLRDLFRQEKELIKAREAELRKGVELEAWMRAAGVRIGDVPAWELPDLQPALGALERFQVEAKARTHKIFAPVAMMHQCTGGGGGGNLIDFMCSSPSYTGGGAGNLIDFMGSGPSSVVNGAGSHEEVAMDRKLMGGGADRKLFDFLGSGSFAAHSTDTHPVTIDTTMMLPAGSLFHYHGSRPFRARGGQDVTVDTKMNLMNGTNDGTATTTSPSPIYL